jgi:hypothetical protein
MKAIRTKFYGPTNTKGAKIVATDGEKNTITISYPYELNVENAHRLAAIKLCEKMGWSTNILPGWFKNECYWIFANQEAEK